jgi:CubicO group peptidase (beta-lactamase class C family)
MKSVVWSGAGGGPRDPAIGYKRLGSSESPDSGWVPNRGLGSLSAGPHGGQFCTASDLARFFRALRSGRLISRASAEMLTTPRRGAGSAYGFGVISFALDRLVGHSGGDAGASADAYTYWKSGYTIVVLSNFSPPASHQVAGVARALLEPHFEPTKPSRP